MQTTLKHKYLCCLLSAIFLFGFKNIDEGPVKLPKSIRKQFAYVPKGTVKFDSDSAIAGDFYISKYEVSNEEYRRFLNDLETAGEHEKFKIAQIDSMGWRTALAYNDPYVKYYHAHEVYNPYPVVNISYEGAKFYCEWLTNKLNTENAGSGQVYEIRLPSRIEWIRASRPDNSWPYSSGYSYMISRGRYSGYFRYNFRYIGAESVHYDTASQSYQVVSRDRPFPLPEYEYSSLITTTVSSYWPNYLGLYNMNGNVAEMVSQKGFAVGGSWSSTGYDIRCESVMNYNEPSPMVGFRPIIVVKKK